MACLQQGCPTTGISPRSNSRVSGRIQTKDWHAG